MDKRTKPEQLFSACAEELNRKALEYGEMGSDYRDMAAFEERKPTEVCFSLMMKHITVLKKIAKDPKKFPLSITRHRAMDLANFVVVLLNEIEKAVAEDEEIDLEANTGTITFKGVVV